MRSLRSRPEAALAALSLLLTLAAAPRARGEERHLADLRVGPGEHLVLGEGDCEEPLELFVAGDVFVAGTVESRVPLRIQAQGTLHVASGASIRAPRTLWLQAGLGTTSWIHGALEVLSRDDVGGTLTLLGDRLGLGPEADLRASGERLGGQIRVGGGHLGVSLGAPAAQRVFVGEGACLTARATRRGDGGRIAIWGEQVARCYGRLDAGDACGWGGEVEVSGAEVAYAGQVWVGRRGVFRIDPATITITDGGPSAAPQADVAFGDAAPTTIAEQTLEGTSAGQNATIVLQAQNQITINNLADNALTLASGVSLTLQTRNDTGQGDTAAGGISVNTGDRIVASGAGALAFDAGAGGTTGTANAVLGRLDTGGQNVTVRASGTLSTNGSEIAAGTLTLASQGALTLAGATRHRANDFFLSSASGSVTIPGASELSFLNGMGTLSISAGGAIGGAGAPITTGGNSVNITVITDSSGANGAQFLNLKASVSALDLNAGTGTITLTTTFASCEIRDTDAAVDVRAGTFNATWVTGLVAATLGTLANPIQTQVTNLGLNSSAVNGPLHVHDLGSPASYSLQAGTGAVSFRVGTGNLIDTGNTLSTTGALSLRADAGTIGTAGDVFALPATTNLTTNTATGNTAQFLSLTGGLTAMNLNAGTGAITFTAGGNLTDTDGSVDVAGGAVALTLGANDLGAAANPIRTTVADLSVTGDGLYVTETDGLSGLNLTIAGTLVLTANGAIADVDGAVDVAATTCTITANNGALGTAANPLGLNVFGSLTTSTATGNGDQFLSEADGLTALALNAGTGSITLSAGGALTDADGTVDVTGGTVSLTTTSGTIGTNAGTPLGLSVTQLTTNTVNADQFLSEADTLTALSLSAGTGNVTLASGGAISDTDAAADVTCNVATITATTGGIGAAANPIGTAVSDLAVTTSAGNGDQFFSETDTLSAVNLSAGTGGITLTAGGAVSDADAAVDFACGALSITLNAGDLGTSGNPIGTNVNTLATATAVSNTDQFLSEFDGLTNMGLTAGTGNVTLSAGGTLTDVASPAVLAATATITVTSGTIGTAGSRIGVQLSTNLIGTTTNADQFWDGLAGGLPGVTLSAGTGAIDLTSTGAISDTDGAVDFTCGALTLAGTALGAGANPLGLNVTSLTTNTSASNGNQFLSEANGLSTLDLNAGTGGVTLSSTTGAISDGDGAVDVTGGAISITVTAGTLGIMGVPVGLAASTSLAVDTSGANGAQFLTSTGTLPVLAANGLNAGTGTITLGAGTLLVNGSSTAGLVQANGGTLGGTGTLGAVQINSGATLAPGASPGITTTGNLNLGAGSTFSAEIGGTSPGTGAGFHDQTRVTGTVTIAPTATLTTLAFGGFVPTGGTTFTLIDNDGADAISGTFSGLAEGALISGFLGSGLVAQVSYVGGDGNDLVLTALGTADLAVTLSVDSATPNVTGPVTYTVRVTNNGPGSASAVQLTYQVPTDVTLNTATASAGTYTSSTGLWVIGTLTNGSSATLTLKSTVGGATLGRTIASSTSGLSASPLGGSTSDDVGSVSIVPKTGPGGHPLRSALPPVTIRSKKGCAIVAQGPNASAASWGALLALVLLLGGVRRGLSAPALAGADLR